MNEIKINKDREKTLKKLKNKEKQRDKLQAKLLKKQEKKAENKDKLAKKILKRQAKQERMKKSRHSHKYTMLLIVSVFVYIFAVFLPNLNAEYDSGDLDNANYLANHSIINDFSDEPLKYNLNSNISRAEILKIMVNIGGLNVEDDKYCVSSFSDISSDDWWCKYANKALELGYIAPNEKFRPRDNVSKAEAIKMLFNAGRIKVAETEIWQDGYIDTLRHLGLDNDLGSYNRSAKRNFVFNVGSEVYRYVVGNEDIKSEGNSKLQNFTNVRNNTNSLIVEADLVSIDKREKSSTTTSSGDKLSVVYFGPEGNITDLNQYITVKFGAPVVANTTLDEQEVCPIELSPKIPGKCVWITSSTFQFRPDNGFAMGSRYSVTIPDKIKTNEAGIESTKQTWTIQTPEFKLLDTSTNLGKDDPLLISFNGEVSIADFAKNFRMDGYANGNLDIKYYSTNNGLDINRRVVSIFPKNGDWGYDEIYGYTISNKLTAERGTSGLINNVQKSFATNKILLDFNPIRFIDIDIENIYKSNNLYISSNKNVILKDHPSVLFTFAEDVKLDKKLFELESDFSLKYLYKYEYIDGEQILVESKKDVVLTINDIIGDTVDIVVKTSSISESKDITETFYSKAQNTIIDYKQLDYSTACIESSFQVKSSNLDRFLKFNDYAQLSYINIVTDRSYAIKGCEYEEGKVKQVLYMTLNPDTTYTLTIKKDLLDIQNYTLDKDYEYKFTTPSAKREDKYISVVGKKYNTTIVPKSLKPLTAAITTTNLTEVGVKICEGGLDITKENYISTSNCINRVIEVNNLGFKPNITVLDIEKIYGAPVSTDMVQVVFSKLERDKTNSQLVYGDDYNSTSAYFLTNIATNIIDAKDNLLWLYDFNTGSNITDSISKIDLYVNKYNSVAGRYQATYDGSVDFTPRDGGLYTLESSKYGILLITLKDGRKTYINSNGSSDNYKGEIINYIFTDRPLYKPGDTLYISGISRIINNDNFTINYKPQDMSIRYSYYDEILNDTIKMGESGAFNYEFTIPQDAKLGEYSIEIGNGGASFMVGEYEKPDFEINLKNKKDEYLFSDKVSVEISGDYYIQTPLDGGVGEWRLKSMNYSFDVGKNNSYMFGDRDPIYWSYYGGDDYNETIDSGSFMLGSNGKYDLELDLPDILKDKIYTLSVDITDPNTKKTISKNINFIRHTTDVFVGLKTDKYFYNYSDTAKIDIISVDKSGDIVANSPYDFTIIKTDYVYSKETKSYDSVESEVYNSSKSTNTNGTSVENYRFSEYGEYKLILTNKQKGGVKGGYTTSRTIYIYGGSVLSPNSGNHELTIISDKDTYSIGDKVNLTINSTDKDLKALVYTSKLDRIIDYRLVDLNDYTTNLSIDVKESHLPNFNIGVIALRDFNNDGISLNQLRIIRREMQSLESELIEARENIIPYRLYDLVIRPIPKVPENSEKLARLDTLKLEELNLLNNILPNYYIGHIDLSVDTSYVGLQTKITLNKTTYKPGDSVDLNLSLKDKNGKGVSGYTTISVVDKALLALKGLDGEDILEFFYGERSNLTNINTNLIDLIDRIDFIDDMDDDLDKGYDDDMLESRMDSKGMFDGMDMMMGIPTREISVSQSLNTGGNIDTSIDVREDFKDLAFYSANVEVINGVAKITIPKLPDDLTTWQILGYSFDDETRVGTVRSEFSVAKDINILPQIPRFFVDGDKSSIDVLVANNTNDNQKVDVSLNMSNVDMVSRDTLPLLLKPNESKLVSFEVIINSKSTLLSNTMINISATSGKLSDAIRVKKPIYPSISKEYVFTNGVVLGENLKEQLDFSSVVDAGGSIDISLGASILTNLTNNLDEVLSYPSLDLYSNLRFLKNAKALQDLYVAIDDPTEFYKIQLKDLNGDFENIESIVSRVKLDIKNYIQSDGLLGTYKKCEHNCSNMSLTQEYLSFDYGAVDLDEQKLYNNYKSKLLDRLQRNSDSKIYITELIPSSRFDDKTFVDKYLNIGDEPSIKDRLTYIEIFDNLGFVEKKASDYIKELKNDIKIEARGSILPGDSVYDSKDTSARFLDILIKYNEREGLIVDNIARYLVSSKDYNKNYYSVSFANIIKSLTTYIDAFESKNPKLETNVSLNDKLIMNSSFDKNNRFNVDTQTIDFSRYLKSGIGEMSIDKTGDSRLYYDMGFSYYLPNKSLEPRDEGIVVDKNYYDYKEYNGAYEKVCIYPMSFYYRIYNPCYTSKTKKIDPILSTNKGDLVVATIEITLDKERNNISINDYIPAGFSIVNTSFDTTSDEIVDITGTDGYRGFDLVEQRDDRIYLYAEHLYAGTYRYTYVLQATNSGEYISRAPRAELLDKPEIWGRARAIEFEIK